MAKEKSKKKQGDFRYEAGEAVVPWHAVGERFGGRDVQEMVEFFMQPRDGSKNYKSRLREAKRAIASASASTSSGGTRIPVSLCRTVSGSPPTFVATTGKPQDDASMAATPKASRRQGRTQMSPPW